MLDIGANLTSRRARVAWCCTACTGRDARTGACTRRRRGVESSRISALSNRTAVPCASGKDVVSNNKIGPLSNKRTLRWHARQTNSGSQPHRDPRVASTSAAE